MELPKYTDLVFDLGGVLFSFSVEGETQLSKRLIRHILDSQHWHEYERGRLTQEQCYDRVTSEFNLFPGVWKETMTMLEGTLVQMEDLVKVVKELKAAFPHLRIHAFSNVSAPDYEVLKPKIKEWGFFDTVVTSSSIGCRKPEYSSYQKLLDAAKIEAKTSIFVDDRSENVVTAHALGFRGILCDNVNNVAAQLHNLLGDPQREGGVIKTNFCQLLILQCIGDRDMVTLDNEGDTWQFFIGEPAFTDTSYPKDADTTSLAHVTLETSSSEKRKAMEEIWWYQTADGLPQLYLDESRPRSCPYVLANVLRFFYLNGQGSKLRTTVEHFYRILDTRAFEIPSRYYIQPEWLFYYLSDMCGKCSDPSLDKLREILEIRLRERMGCDKDVLAVAMRVLAAQALGFGNSRDMATLLATQQADGGWPLTWMWRYGQVDVKMGSRGIPTALAVKAIRTAYGKSSSGKQVNSNGVNGNEVNGVEINGLSQ